MRAAVLALLLPLAEAKSWSTNKGRGAIQKQVSAKIQEMSKSYGAKARRGKVLVDCMTDTASMSKMANCVLKSDEATCTGTSGCNWCMSSACFPSDVVCTVNSGGTPMELNNGCPSLGCTEPAYTDDTSSCDMSCACMTSQNSRTTAAREADQLAEEVRENATDACERAVVEAGDPPADKTDGAAAETFCQALIAEWAGKGRCHTANPAPATHAACASFGNCHKDYQMTKQGTNCPGEMEGHLTAAWPAGVPAGAPSCTAAVLCAAERSMYESALGSGSPASKAAASLLLTAVAAAVAAFSL